MNTRDIADVMGVDEDMIPLLGKLARKAPAMNPWVRQLPGILRGLRLDRHSNILDMPCGCGAVSVPLAINYGSAVIGYDAFPPNIEAARQLAATKGVADRCSFQTGDIRQVVTIADCCDVLLWVAAPHLWDTTTEIIAQLRNCVRSGGTVVFADAYRLTDEPIYDFCTRDETNRQLEDHGDKVRRVYDYDNRLWPDDYRRTIAQAESVLKGTDDAREKRMLVQYIAHLRESQVIETRLLGLAVWVLTVNKE